MTGIGGLYHEPLGVDFSRAVVAGLRHRMDDPSPERLSRVTILTNTRRMSVRLQAAFAETGATLLPRIALVSEPESLLLPGSVSAPGLSTLALRLRLTQLVRRRLEFQPGLSPPSAAFDLAGSLQALLDEIDEEGIDPDRLEDLDTRGLPDHWIQSLAFLRIITR